MSAHPVEIEDLPFVPSWFRDLGTDWVRFTSERLGLYRSVANELATLLKASDSRYVLDVCSGSGGGWLSPVPQLDALGVDNLRITLSDKYPNLRAAAYLAQNSDGRIQYCEHPFDVVREADDGADPTP